MGDILVLVYAVVIAILVIENSRHIRRTERFMLEELHSLHKRIYTLHRRVADLEETADSVGTIWVVSEK